MVVGVRVCVGVLVGVGVGVDVLVAVGMEVGVAVGVSGSGGRTPRSAVGDGVGVRFARASSKHHRVASARMLPAEDSLKLRRPTDSFSCFHFPFLSFLA